MRLSTNITNFVKLKTEERGRERERETDILFIVYLHVLDRGSRGPSTVTLIAFAYVATWGGLVDIVIVTEKLLPIWK